MPEKKRATAKKKELPATRSLLRQAYLALLTETVIILFLSLFSGPMRKLGITEMLPFDLNPYFKVGRAIFVYHAVAVPFVAALLFLALHLLKIEGHSIIKPAHCGYLATVTGALGFAFGGRNWVFHAIFITGLTISFYAGCLFVKALIERYREKEDAETLLFMLTSIFVLISVVIGAIPGAYFGNGFKAFLAEDTIGASHDLYQRAIISHLHILLALIDTFLMLLIFARFDFLKHRKDLLLKMTLLGLFVVTFGTWAVMPFEKIAHKMINVGSVFLLIPAFYAGYLGIRERYKDAPDFGVFLMLITVNLFVTGPGVYVAVNLEKFRALPYAQERIFAVGHWHILGTFTAIMAFLLLVSLTLEGKSRQVTAWTAIAGSHLAFTGGVTYLFSPALKDPALILIQPGILLMLFSVIYFLCAATQRQELKA